MQAMSLSKTYEAEDEADDEEDEAREEEERIAAAASKADSVPRPMDQVRVLLALFCAAPYVRTWIA